MIRPLLADATTASLIVSMSVMALALVAIWVTVLNTRNANRRIDHKVDQDYALVQDAEIEDLRRDLKECKQRGDALELALEISDKKYIRLLKSIDDERDQRRG